MLLKSKKQNLRNKKDENLFGFHLFFIPFLKVLATHRLGLEFLLPFFESVLMSHPIKPKIERGHLWGRLSVL